MRAAPHSCPFEDMERFSRLVERIYDASLNSALWPEVLEQTCTFVGGCAGLLYYQSIGGTSASLFHSWGEDSHFLQLYRDKYIALNPLHPAALFLEVGKVHALPDMMPVEEFRATRLYKEWARPQGILDALCTNLERTATGAAALIIRRREQDGLFDEEAKARCALIVPHVRRAVAIGKVVEFHKDSALVFSRAMETLDGAVLLVAPDGRLVHVNEVGAAMLTAGDLLRAPNGRLSAAAPRVNAELQAAIVAAARGDATLGAKGIAISLTSEGSEPQVAHVLSLTSGRRRDMFAGPQLASGNAAAAVFVRKASFATPAPLETLAQLYGLTAGEVRVLAAVAEETGIATLAARLGIGQATVKTHLRRIFAKTGTRRQADLVKLLADYGGTRRP